jgi:hypothetical protein
MASLWLVVRAVGRDPDGDALFLKDGLSLLESRPYPFGDPAGTAGVIGGDGPRHGLAPGIDFLAERLEALDAVLAEQELDVVLEIGQLPEEGVERSGNWPISRTTSSSCSASCRKRASSVSSSGGFWRNAPTALPRSSCSRTIPWISRRACFETRSFL